jgi:2-dehydropantoate 2-reductase
MQANHRPPVAVVGAGAVGCYFGGMLARSGVRVTLIGREPHMGAMARDGLLLDGLRVNQRIPIAATTNIAEGVRDAGVVLFCVKTVATETAARALQPFLAPNTVILSFQNGVDNVDRIYSAMQSRAVPVAVYVAGMAPRARSRAPRRYVRTGRGPLPDRGRHRHRAVDQDGDELRLQRHFGAHARPIWPDRRVRAGARSQ